MHPNPMTSPRRLWPPLAFLCLILFVFPAPAHGQIIDPCFSEVEVLCPNPLFVVPNGQGDPLGDLGILVTCRDGNGDPIPGIPASAFDLEAGFAGFETFVSAGTSTLADAATDENGRIYLTNPIRAGGFITQGGIVVTVDTGGGPVRLDCGASNDVQVRSPDFNGDLVVNLSDLTLFVPCYYGSNCPQADLDGDGVIGLSDVVLMQRFFGASGSPAVFLRSIETAASSSKRAASEDLFAGCLQRDFDENDGPEIVRDTITVAPMSPFSFKILVKDFDVVSGVEFDLTLPAGVSLFLGGCFQAVSPFVPAPGLTVPCGVPTVPTIQVVVDGTPCVTSGPVFVAEFTLWSNVPQELRVEQFLLEGKLSDCNSRPNEFTACIGTPTPCEVSYLDFTADPFLMCPGGDLDTSEILTLVLRDQNGDGVAGVPAGDVVFTLEDEMGSDLHNTFEILPQATETDADGKLPYLFQPRETCLWDRCLDLRIRAELEGCELSVFKAVRSVNVVRFEDQPFGDFDVVDLSDVAVFTQALFTADPCLDLFQNFRCPYVTRATESLVANHVGHQCSVVGVEDLPSRASIEIGQNAPNPFNPMTVFEVITQRDIAGARLDVYTPAGRHVRQIWSGTLAAPSQVFTWDGTDGKGLAVASGVYVARLTGDGEDASIQMVLLR